MRKRKKEKVRNTCEAIHSMFIVIRFEILYRRFNRLECWQASGEQPHWQYMKRLCVCMPANDCRTRQLQIEYCDSIRYLNKRLPANLLHYLLSIKNDCDNMVCDFQSATKGVSNRRWPTVGRTFTQNEKPTTQQ